MDSAQLKKIHMTQIVLHENGMKYVLLMNFKLQISHPGDLVFMFQNMHLST